AGAAWTSVRSRTPAEAKSWWQRPVDPRSRGQSGCAAPPIFRVASAGFPFIGGALALAALAGAAGGWIFAAPLAVLAVFFAFFFRDPERRVPPHASENDVLSPADGEVLVAGEAMADAAPPGSWRQVSIFLSPMDVHVNRV